MPCALQMTCFWGTRVFSAVLRGRDFGEEEAVLREEGHAPAPHLEGEGRAGLTNGLVIHRWALVCANWLCWPPDSWQGAGLWGTPVSLPCLPPRMAA